MKRKKSNYTELINRINFLFSRGCCHPTDLLVTCLIATLLILRVLESSRFTQFLAWYSAYKLDLRLFPIWLIYHTHSEPFMQLHEWFSPSVCLFVCSSVTPFHYVHITVLLWDFMRHYQWQKWCPCKRSGSEVKGQGHRGQSPILSFPDRDYSLNSHMAMKWCTKLSVA